MTTIHCPPPQGVPAPDGAGAGSLGRTVALLGVSALASVFLVACGGDSDSTATSQPTATNEMPTSAVASDATLEAFAIAQPQSETAKPFLLDNVPTFPSSETEQPIKLP